MNYQISEEDFYRLESVRDQLAFITGLIDGSPTAPSLSAITVSQLRAFVNAQQNTLESIIAAAEEREHALRELNGEGGSMCWADWMNALRVARGDALHTPSGTEMRIAHKLSAMARIDADMSSVLDEWNLVLEGMDKSSKKPAAPATKAPATSRKREKLARAEA